MDIYSKIDEIGEYIEKAQVMPVINKKVLEPSILMKALEDLYAAVPQEIKEARQALEETDKRKAEAEAYVNEIISKSKEEAEKILRSAQEESARILDEHNLKQMVEEEAKRIKREVLEESEDLKRQVVEETEHVRRQALEHARELEKKALTRARKIKSDADQYAEEILNHIEANLTQIQAINKNGRKFLSELREKDVLESSNL